MNSWEEANYLLQLFWICSSYVTYFIDWETESQRHKNHTPVPTEVCSGDPHRTRVFDPRVCSPSSCLYAVCTPAAVAQSRDCRSSLQAALLGWQHAEIAHSWPGMRATQEGPFISQELELQWCSSKRVSDGVRRLGGFRLYSPAHTKYIQFFFPLCF